METATAPAPEIPQLVSVAIVYAGDPDSVFLTEDSPLRFCTPDKLREIVQSMKKKPSGKA